METKGEWVYGRRPVMEVLRAKRRHVYEVVLPSGGRDSPDVAELRSLALTGGIPLRSMGRTELDALSAGGHHQGVAVRVGGYPYVSLEQIVHDVREQPQALVLLLDHIEDPQNVGALMRTAEAAGVTGIILPEDRAAAVTPAVVRASAGASEHMRVSRTVNLVRAMQALQEAGAWLAGLDMGDDARPYTQIDFLGRMGVVVGAEGEGLGRLVRESCDFIAAIPMRGQIASLNAGVAGGIVLFEAVRQRTLARNQSSGKSVPS